MGELIDIFRMKEVPHLIRVEIIRKLGEAINHQYTMNITNELVEVLVKELLRQMEQE